MTDNQPATGFDLNAVTAIDMHVHVEQDNHGCFALDPELMAASAAYFKANDHRAPTLAHIAAYYRQQRMAAVVFTVDAATATGHPALSSEEIADQAAQHPDVLIPFGSVDPQTGAAAVRRARTLVTEHGVRGFKFHPSLQAFEPNDRAFYPLYEVLQELGVPALFHTGQTGIGAGLPGGRGIKLRYSAPMLIDDVAADLPDLTIIMAHPSVPWQDEAISIATHKSNVYIDLSGWSPKYFPPQLIRAANSFLQRKVLFGSDFPLLTPQRWLADFDKLDIKPDVKPLILKENAARLLRLTDRQLDKHDSWKHEEMRAVPLKITQTRSTVQPSEAPFTAEKPHIEFVRLTEVPLPAVVALLNEPRNARHMPLSGEFSEEATADWVRGKDEQWDTNGYGPWAVLLNGEFAGWCGFQHEDNGADFALVLSPERWGNGAEITRAALKRGFQELGLDDVVIALPYTRNPTRVVARFGFVPDGDVSYGRASFRQYRLTREAWAAAITAGPGSAW